MIGSDVCRPLPPAVASSSGRVTMPRWCAWGAGPSSSPPTRSSSGYISDAPGSLLGRSGVLGAAGVAVRDLKAGRRGRLPEPPRRVGVGVALARVASAMIDVSDGLVQDLGHLCRASRVAAEVDLAALPVARACVRALG